MLKKLVYFRFKHGSKKEISHKEANKMATPRGEKFINASASNQRMLGNKHWMPIHSINITMSTKNISKRETHIYLLFHHFWHFEERFSSCR